MTTAQSLSHRMQVGEEFQSVVRTMKGLASVSINEYEQAVAALREYSATIEFGLQILFMARPDLIPKKTPPTGRVAGIVIGTDQGLCGLLNSEIATHANTWFREHHIEADRRLVVAMGERAGRELALAGLSPSDQMTLPGSVEGIGTVVEDLVSQIERWQTAADITRIVVFFQHPVHRARRTPRTFQIAPPDAARLGRIAQRPWPTRMLPSFPHADSDLLVELIRQDLFVALYRSIAEAKAAEHGSRLSAMQAAEQNIEERLAQLGNEYRRSRQAEITAQLRDIISGFEALTNV